MRQPPPSDKPNRAVLYLRVSDPKQVATDYDPEDISLPAQRKACQHKADQLGLTVVGEYVEAGVSGREMTRLVEFQKLLNRVKRDQDITHVIVYKLSRLARNRIDEALIMDQFGRRGVALVSATEPIDNSPEGQFMQGILSAMNQFRSQQDGEDVAYKMGEKAKNGGTLGPAPLGYKNVTVEVEGRKIHTIEIDPVRGPLIQQAFQLYADGHTVQGICDALAARGLVSRASPKRASGPLTDGGLSRILRNPYYIGYVTYKGQQYPGRHEPLIDKDLFAAVQAIAKTRGTTSERYRTHDHVLKGLLWCGECHDRGGSSSRNPRVAAVAPTGTTSATGALSPTSRTCTRHTSRCRALRTRSPAITRPSGSSRNSSPTCEPFLMRRSATWVPTKRSSASRPKPNSRN